MEVILDKDTGRVYVKREPTEPGITPKHTHQFAKFGVTMVWDGHGELLGIEFDNNRPEVAMIRTVSSEELARQEASNLWLSRSSSPRRQGASLLRRVRSSSSSPIVALTSAEAGTRM